LEACGLAMRPAAAGKSTHAVAGRHTAKGHERAPAPWMRLEGRGASLMPARLAGCCSMRLVVLRAVGSVGQARLLREEQICIRQATDLVRAISVLVKGLLEGRADQVGEQVA
jgi:hypothetical protein